MDRAYQLIPDHSRVAALWGLFLRGNQSVAPGFVIPEGDIDVNLWILQYTHAFAVGHRQAAVFGVFPLGEVKGSVPLTTATLSASSSGIADVTGVRTVMVLGARAARGLSLPQPAWLWRIPPYAIGGLAGYWVVTRLAAF